MFLGVTRNKIKCFDTNTGKRIAQKLCYYKPENVCFGQPFQYRHFGCCNWMGLLPFYKRLVLLNNTAYSELPDRTDQKFR